MSKRNKKRKFQKQESKSKFPESSQTLADLCTSSSCQTFLALIQGRHQQVAASSIELWTGCVELWNDAWITSISYGLVFSREVFGGDLDNSKSILYWLCEVIGSQCKTLILYVEIWVKWGRRAMNTDAYMRTRMLVIGVLAWSIFLLGFNVLYISKSYWHAFAPGLSTRPFMKMKLMKMKLWMKKAELDSSWRYVSSVTAILKSGVKVKLRVSTLNRRFSHSRDSMVIVKVWKTIQILLTDFQNKNCLMLIKHWVICFT